VTPSNDRLLRPEEVATIFGVATKTVQRWAKDGKLHPQRTLGGHRRYKESEVRQLLSGGQTRETPTR
jgi:excisionase family DNA binding protein